MSRAYRKSPKVISEEITSHSHGVLTEWNDERGYGFITPNNGGEKIFLHVTNICEEAGRPTQGELFCYKINTDSKGRLQAVNAFQVSLNSRCSKPYLHRIISWVSKCWWLLLLFYLYLKVEHVKLGMIIFLAFIFNSLLTILFYWSDKFSAQYKYYRIPEKNLHCWELFCGWPGAWYAQYIFRHKKSKSSFMNEFYVCVVLNIAAIVLLLTFENNIIYYCQELKALFLFSL